MRLYHPFIYNENLFIDGVLSERRDRNRKENLTAVDCHQILHKLKEIPVSTWNYTGDGTTHLRPMAQDFLHAFQLGASDKSISGLDMRGVLLVAAQAQQTIIDKAMIEQQNREIAEIKVEL